MKKIFLHFGYPRTATTSLQKNFFPIHPDINYWGKFRQINTKNRSLLYAKGFYKIYEKILHYENDIFDNQFNNLKNEFSEIYEKNYKKDKVNLISEEYIFLDCVHYDQAKKNKFERSLKRFEKLFNEVDLEITYFFTIRNQTDFLKSFYTATTIGKGSIKYTVEELKNFLNSKTTKNKNLELLLEELNYFKIVEYLRTNLKSSNFKVFIYEDFLTKKEQYIDQLSEFLVIDRLKSNKIFNFKKTNSSVIIFNENECYNSKYNVFLSLVKKNIFEPKYLIKNLHKKIYATLLFFFRNKNFKGSLEQRKTRYLNDLIEIENQRKNIRNFYQSENEKLEKYLNLDLKKFKY
jgi:hypothetical protein